MNKTILIIHNIIHESWSWFKNVGGHDSHKDDPYS